MSNLVSVPKKGSLVNSFIYRALMQEGHCEQWSNSEKEGVLVPFPNN